MRKKNMSKIQKIGKLSPNEEAVAKRVLLGKEKIFKFENATDAINALEKSRQKALKIQHK
jgi:hypothetical protein